MKGPEDCASIEDVRAAIDGIDHQMLHLLGRRALYVKAAARFKTGERDVQAPERRGEMLARRRRWAEEQALDPDFVEDLYEDIVSYFVQREMDHWNEERFIDNDSR